MKALTDSKIISCKVSSALATLVLVFSATDVRNVIGAETTDAASATNSVTAALGTFQPTVPSAEKPRGVPP